MSALVVGDNYVYYLPMSSSMPMVSSTGEILPPPCTKIMPPFGGEPGSLYLKVFTWLPFELIPDGSASRVETSSPHQHLKVHTTCLTSQGPMPTNAQTEPLLHMRYHE